MPEDGIRPDGVKYIVEKSYGFALPNCDFESAPPHPLIYASLEPCYSPTLVKRMDLHDPKATYTIGRGPLNDFVLDEEESGQIGE